MIIVTCMSDPAGIIVMIVTITGRMGTQFLYGRGEVSIVDNQSRLQQRA